MGLSADDRKAKDGWPQGRPDSCAGEAVLAQCNPGVNGPGQHTETVNPWYNQTVDYLAVTEFFYCRHYVSNRGAISAYCS
jgi:hypothetical protein